MSPSTECLACEETGEEEVVMELLDTSRGRAHH